MVQKSSALLFLTNELRFPVTSNHTDLVKFNSSDEKTFQDVVTCMESCYGGVNQRLSALSYDGEAMLTK